MQKIIMLIKRIQGSKYKENRSPQMGNFCKNCGISKMRNKRYQKYREALFKEG